MKTGMNRRIIKIVIIACCVAIPLAFIVKVFFPWTFYPIESLPHTLSVVMYSGSYTNKPVITLKHYVNDVHIRDYTLLIKNGVGIQDPQEYDLPKLDDGRVEVNVELGDDENSCFSIAYDSAVDFYEEGFLIYLTGNESKGTVIDLLVYYDKYVYFVSGEKKICYFNKAASSGWVAISDAPSLKNVARNAPDPYYVWDSKWEENEWDIMDVNNLAP